MKVSKFLFGFLIVMLLLPLFHEPVFAVYIFSDGFETGNTGAWTSVGGDVDVTTTHPHSGTYSANTTSALAGTLRDLLAASYTELYFRAYFYFTVVDAGSSSPTTIMVIADPGTASNLELQIVDVGNHAHFELYNNHDYTTNNTGIDVNIDTWYCLEVAYRNTTDGFMKLWIDGTLRAVTWHDFSATTGNKNVYIGAYARTALVSTFWFDDCVVDSSYIGVLGGGPTAYKVDLTQSVTAGFTVLLKTTFQSTLSLSSTVGLSIFNKAAFTVVSAFSATAGFLVDLIMGHVGIAYFIDLALNPTFAFLNLLQTNFQVLLSTNPTVTITDLLITNYNLVLALNPSVGMLIDVVMEHITGLRYFVDLALNPTLTITTLLNANYNLILGWNPTTLWELILPEAVVTTADIALALGALAFIIAMTGIGLFALRRRD